MTVCHEERPWESAAEERPLLAAPGMRGERRFAKPTRQERGVSAHWRAKGQGTRMKAPPDRLALGSRGSPLRNNGTPLTPRLQSSLLESRYRDRYIEKNITKTGKFTTHIRIAPERVRGMYDRF